MAKKTSSRPQRTVVARKITIPSENVSAIPDTPLRPAIDPKQSPVSQQTTAVPSPRPDIGLLPPLKPGEPMTYLREDGTVAPAHPELRPSEPNPSPNPVSGES